MNVSPPTVVILCVSAFLTAGCTTVNKHQGLYGAWKHKAYTAYNQPMPRGQQYLAKNNAPKAYSFRRSNAQGGDTISWAERQKTIAIENTAISASEQDYIKRYYGI